MAVAFVSASSSVVGAVIAVGVGAVGGIIVLAAVPVPVDMVAVSLMKLLTVLHVAISVPAGM